MTPVLHIGDKNYSSWSMRPWLALRHGGVAFEEKSHELPEIGAGPPAFKAVSPTGRVPALHLKGGVIVSDSLAICEWAAEQAPSLWPADPAARAVARSAAAIMHSGFMGLRNDAPMNIRRRTNASRMTPAGLADAALVDELWSGWIRKYGGPFLFGAWSIADAMYAPVVTRFVTYAIPRSAEADQYINMVTGDAQTAIWIAAANAETRALPRSDVA